MSISVYTIVNGSVGYGEVRVYIAAETEEDALSEAENYFKAEGEGRGYRDSYWTRLNIVNTVAVLSTPIVVGCSDD